VTPLKASVDNSEEGAGLEQAPKTIKRPKLKVSKKYFTSFPFLNAQPPRIASRSE
jgi:hypothetical protein